MTLKLLLSFFLSFYSPESKPSPGIIEGYVFAESTGNAVARAHVYVVEGEEEALTDAKGHFKIETWQKFPLQLTVKYKEHPAYRVNVAEASSRQVIRLKGI